MATKTKTQTGPSNYTILMNWVKDGNLKSPFPKDLEKSGAISPTFILSYFETSVNYFPYINKIYNKISLFYVPIKDLMLTFKEMIYFTGYRYFSGRIVTPKENGLIKLLWKKYPYLKKEEICMIVDWIDQSEDKDTIYEMFNLNNKTKPKKMTKAEAKEREKTIKSIVSSKDVMDMI